MSTANNNHNHVQPTTSISSIAHKPVVKTLKPVEEADGAYMRMENSMDDWTRAGTSPKQVPSPMQDDYMQMNGPPGRYSRLNIIIKISHAHRCIE